ncbi:MAG: hypothetical protein AB7H97_15035 [Pseudobdellovibrionaceae bacterium]
MNSHISRLLGMALGLCVFAGSVGHAAADKEEISTTGNYLIARNNTFLKCIADRKKWYKGYLFYWNPKYLYSRKVMAIPLEYLNKGTVLGNQVVVHCKNWRQLHDLMAEREDIKSFAIESKDFDWSKYPLRPTDKDSIRQAEEGAFEYATMTPAEYWERNKKDEFTREENKEITERFGPFFSSLVFKEYIMEDPKNVAFASNLKRNFHTEDKKEFFGPRFDKVRVLIAPGYMEDPKSSHVQAMIYAMKKGGVDVVQLEMNSLNDLNRNSNDILKHLKSELKSGRSIIMMGASKGVPEILAALIKAKQQGISLNNVKAFVGISGTVRGSFLADWILRPFYFTIAKPFLTKEAKKTGLPFTDLRESLRTQSTEFLNAYFEKRKADIPKEDPFYQI